MYCKTFVRQSFYVPCPEKNANAEEWAAWQKADDAAARVAKAQFTKQRNKTACDLDKMPELGLAKVNGRYKQVTLMGFEDGGENEFGQAVPVVEAKQDNQVDYVKQRSNSLTHRTHAKSNHRAKRQALREVRKAKYRRLS